MKIIVIIFAVVLSSISYGQTKYCTNNYVIDSSDNKRPVLIDLDAIQFMQWVNDYWTKKGELWVNKRGEKLTAKKLWLYWYKETNACWWE